MRRELQRDINWNIMCLSLSSLALYLQQIDEWLSESTCLDNEREKNGCYLSNAHCIMVIRTPH